MRQSPKLSPGQCAQLACLLEVMARKPGNVHPEAGFQDASFYDFVASAVVIGSIMDQAVTQEVGRTVLACVQQCRALVGTNTNLGMVLLLAPMAAVRSDEPLHAGVARVLSELTVSDTVAVYEGIRLAAPGGLGTVADQDVATEPTVNLRSAMQLAADRDLIARQYANGFDDVFGIGVPELESALRAGFDWERAIIRCHLVFMSKLPDTLIARKLGMSEALESARRAAAVLAAGWPEGDESRRLFAELDQWLREQGNRRNPGATADLVAAALFAVLRGGTKIR